MFLEVLNPAFAFADDGLIKAGRLMDPDSQQNVTLKRLIALRGPQRMPKASQQRLPDPVDVVMPRH